MTSVRRTVPLKFVLMALVLGSAALLFYRHSAAERESHALAIAGYNYTNRYIDSFEVNGQGGGNLDVIKTTGGGGGSATCCIGWRDGTRLPEKVRVKWVSGGCMRRVTNSLGESRWVPRHYYSEVDAVLYGPIPKDPGYFEVHFYPDGHVEVAITELPSEPRLMLDPAREVDPYPATCPDAPR